MVRQVPVIFAIRSSFRSKGSTETKGSEGRYVLQFLCYLIYAKESTILGKALIYVSKKEKAFT